MELLSRHRKMEKQLRLQHRNKRQENSNGENLCEILWTGSGTSCVENFEKEFVAIFSSDPWQVRNEYLKVIYDRSEDNVKISLTSQNRIRLMNNSHSLNDKIRFLKLMEIQRMSMLMFTSCGWFFDNITGIETLQVLRIRRKSNAVISRNHRNRSARPI